MTTATGTLILSGHAFEIHELNAVGLLKFKLWVIDQAARRYNPLRWWLAKIGICRPWLPPAWWISQVELSEAGARGLASLMVPSCPEELITAANAPDVTCYLLDHRTIRITRMSGPAPAIVDQINQARAKAGVSPLKVANG